MKKLRLLSLGLFSVLAIVVACTADDLTQADGSASGGTVSPGNPGATFGLAAPSTSGAAGRIAESVACGKYNIALESITQIPGNKWEWVWSVQNLNPGNGQNGTTQDLSNWGMQFGTCIAPSSIVGVAYSTNGTSWTSGTIEYGQNPSGCLIGNLLKFDYGTTGSALSYYKVTVNQNYMVGYVPGYYKSGSITGCCIFNFNGMGCPSSTDE